MNEPREPHEIQSQRIGPLARLPVFLSLAGKRVLLAGGTQGAAWKAELLSAAGAHVEVFAEEISEEMRRLAAAPPRGAIVLHARTWSPEDLVGAVVAVGAFEADSAAAAFACAARVAGVPVNVIDKSALCDFSFGSIVNRSPLVIGISTAGAAPVFAQAIRAKLEALLPQGFAVWAGTAARWRKTLRRTGLSFGGRRKFWQLFAARALTEPTREPTQSDFDRLVTEAGGLGAAVDGGSVTLVGAGPGDPELLTLRAVRALQSADVILFDDWVSHHVLDFARREAKRLPISTTGHGSSSRQDDIIRLMVRLAGQGKRVVRLKGGDPLIFGRGCEEIDACTATGIAVEVVPGITAAQGVAARLGPSPTSRVQARQVRCVTGHAKDGKLSADIDWQSLADRSAITAINTPAASSPWCLPRCSAHHEEISFTSIEHDG